VKSELCTDAWPGEPAFELGRCLGIPPADITRAVFLDTETSGLSGGTGTVAFLVGIAGWERQGLAVRQYLLRNYDEEPALLWAVGEVLRRFPDGPVLVTYNGRCFDWPLLTTRRVMARVVDDWPSPRHLDLLPVVRALYRDTLPDCALGTVERAMLGIEREEDIPGGMIPGRYFSWLRGGTGDYLGPVLRHNRQDLVSMPVLLAHLEQVLAGRAFMEARVRYGRARFLEGRGYWKDALGEYRRLWTEGGLPQRGSLGLRLARLLRRSGEWRPALSVLRECWVTRCHPYPAAIELAKLLEHQARDPGAARAVVAEALDVLPGAVIPLLPRWQQDLEKRMRRLESKLSHGALKEAWASLPLVVE
jgi:uncharacterized protein YprB with RNaseH-like and TPR domain